MESKERKKVFAVLLLLAGVNLFIWLIVRGFNQQSGLEVNFFDVGQGDAIFVETPYSHQILIDGGPDERILEKLNREMPFWDTSIDMIVLTHPEKDHLSGLLNVLKRYKIDYILWTGIVRETPEYQEWQRLIKEENATIIIAEAGQRINFGEKIYFDILFPSAGLEGKLFDKSNETSIVGRFTWKGKSFLFTGDIGQKTEKELINKNFLDSDVLKIAHHGSKYSSSEKFLEEVSPAIAVIQVGKDNKYGHPATETLERLRKYAKKILRTDENGDIKIISDGETLKLITNN